MSATASLPTLENATTAAGNVTTGLSTFLDSVGSLGSGPSSPLQGLTAAMGGLELHLQINVSGITERLPQALTAIRNALPDDSLRYVADVEQAYGELKRFLTDSPLLKQIEAGSSLEQTALACIDEVLTGFRARLTELAANLIGAEDLTQAREALQLIEDLVDNPSGHSGDLPAFLSHNLLGVAPNLLEGASAHVRAALAVLDPMSDTNLALEVTPARAAVAVTFKEVALAVKGFDPADAAQYGALELALEALENAIGEGFDALEAFYHRMQVAVESHAWDSVFTTYRQILEALPLEAIPTVDDVVDQLGGVLDDFLARLTMALSPEDLAERITRLSTGLQETFAQSPLGQVRRVLLEFLDQIRQAIERVPTEPVKAAVEGMLARVEQELDALGITSIRSAIEKALQDAQKFIDDNLNSKLLEQVTQGLRDALGKLKNIPIEEVGEELTKAINAAEAVVTNLQGSLADGLEEVSQFLAGLEELSFKPIADEVVEEIEALASKLASIRPEALSDAERMAIQAAVRLLRAINLGKIIDEELKRGFSDLSDAIKATIRQIIAAWQDFRRRLEGYGPESVMDPLASILDEVTGALQRLNAGAVLAPLYELLATLEDRLAALSPVSLLSPLQEPYEQMMSVVERVNPDAWVEPLRTLYTEIDKLLGYVDVRPLLTKLEQKEKELFTEFRQAILSGLDSVDLPAPLDSFYDQLKTIALVLTDALFADPEAALHELNVSVRDSVKLSTLFEPLDLVFERLLQALDGVPRDDLVSVMDGLRRGIGLPMRAIDPRHLLRQLRAGEGRLADLSPAMAAAAIPALPALRPSLAARLELVPPDNQAAAISLLARFDLAIQPVRVDTASSRLRQLQTAHDALVNSLRQKINSLEGTGAEAAYTRLHANLGRLLPAFLQQSEPLTYEQIRAGLAELRPSNKARRLDASVALFLSRLQPIEDAIEPAANELLRMIKETALIIHPATLKDAVGGIYDTIWEKLHLLDPDQLAGSLRKSYALLLDPLKALDPSAIATQLDGLYRGIVASLFGDVPSTRQARGGVAPVSRPSVKGLIDEVRDAVEQRLAEVRQHVAGIVKGLQTDMAGVVKQLQGLLGKVDALLLEDLFGRLLQMMENLETSFNEELDRVRNEFDAMLEAIPLPRLRSRSG